MASRHAEFNLQIMIHVLKTTLSCTFWKQIPMIVLRIFTIRPESLIEITFGSAYKKD